MLAVCKCKGPIFILHQPEKCTSPFSSRSWSKPVRSTDCKLLWFLIAKFNKLQAAQPQVSKSESPAINTCHIVIVIVSTFIGGLTWVDAIWRCEPVAPRLVPQWEKRAWNIVWWQLAKPLQGLQDNSAILLHGAKNKCEASPMRSQRSRCLGRFYHKLDEFKANAGKWANATAWTT